MTTQSEDVQTTVAISKQLSRQDTEILWQLYEEAFAPHRHANPCRQEFHEAEFVDAAKDPEFFKLIGKRGGKVVYFAMGTRNFGKLPWIAPEFYDHHYPEFRDRRIYVPVIFVRLDSQGMGHAEHLFKSLQEYVHRIVGRCAVFFDYGGAPPKNLLPSIILKTPGTQRLKDGPLGTQFYDAVVTTPPEE